MRIDAEGAYGDLGSGNETDILDGAHTRTFILRLPSAPVRTS